MSGSGVSVTSLFKTIVNGNLLNTPALPESNSLRAIDGLHGASGWRVVSKTKT
jgi:hypothetical protein